MYVATEVQIRYQGSPCNVCGGQSDSETGFSTSPSVFPWNIIPAVLNTYLSLTAAVYNINNGMHL